MPLARSSPATLAAAAVLAQPFTLALIALRVFAPPTSSHWQRADPILGLLPRDLTIVAVPLLGVGVSLAWYFAVRPSRRDVARATAHAAMGALIAVVAICALRLVAGSHLPAFIPPEESAGPGVTLGLSAGYVEEVLFRLVLLPAVFLPLAVRIGPRAAGVTAVLLTGLAFATLHAIGAAPWSAAHFATRFALPGCAFSVAALVVGPSFVVGAHCSAHLVIPFLFV